MQISRNAKHQFVEFVFKFQTTCATRSMCATCAYSTYVCDLRVSMRFAWFVIVSLRKTHVCETHVAYTYMKNMIFANVLCHATNVYAISTFVRHANNMMCGSCVRVITSCNVHCQYIDACACCCWIRNICTWRDCALCIVSFASCVNTSQNVLFSRVTRSICVHVWLIVCCRVRSLHAHIRVFRHVLTYKRCICVNKCVFVSRRYTYVYVHATCIYMFMCAYTYV